jgi:hypothetical protein
VAVDLFHVVQLVVKAVGDVRRRATREKYGRRGKEGNPEYGIKGLLNHNLERLSPAQFAMVIQTLDADGHGQEIALAWIAKEKLRAALNLRMRFSRSKPCERQVRDRFFAFYDWCAAHEAIPELITLATTISRWEDQIVCRCAYQQSYGLSRGYWVVRASSSSCTEGASAAPIRRNISCACRSRAFARAAWPAAAAQRPRPASAWASSGALPRARAISRACW